MKKVFKLTDSNKTHDRQIDSIKFEVKKYIARERKKTIPEGMDFWDFDCKVGSNVETASSVHISKLNSKISVCATANRESIYLEILSKPVKRVQK